MIKLNKKIKKLTALTTLTVTLALGATPVLAKTVYYKGYAVMELWSDSKWFMGIF